jgi:hypothetical protein
MFRYVGDKIGLSNKRRTLAGGIRELGARERIQSEECVIAL